MHDKITLQFILGLLSFIPHTKWPLRDYNDNMPSVVPQVGLGRGKCTQTLSLSLWSKEFIFNRFSAQN